MSQTKTPIGPYSIIAVLRKEFPDIPEKDIIRICTRLWTEKGILKYLKKTESFSVNRLFFFSVNKKKKDKVLVKRRKDYKKYMRTYRKRLKQGKVNHRY